jgi:hypothetical protein
MYSAGVVHSSSRRCSLEAVPEKRGVVRPLSPLAVPSAGASTEEEEESSADDRLQREQLQAVEVFRMLQSFVLGPLAGGPGVRPRC